MSGDAGDQFAGDVRPRALSATPLAPPSFSGFGGDMAVSTPLGIGTGLPEGGPGASYAAASARLAAVAAEAATAAYVAEKAILAGRIASGTYTPGSEDFVNGMARLGVLNAALGVDASDLYGSGNR